VYYISSETNFTKTVNKKFLFYLFILSLRNFYNMKRIFAAWLMDIAKYVVTALLLSSALTEFVDGWVFYVVALGLVAFIVTVGLTLYKLADKDDKKKNIKV